MHASINTSIDGLSIRKTNWKNFVIRCGAMVRCLVLFLAISPAVEAALTAYPTPPNAKNSSTFSLKIDGTPVPVMSHMDYHYAHFEFSQTINVTISTSQSISHQKIGPASLGISPIVSGNELSFSITQSADADSTPRYLVVQINDLEKLVLLGDPPETGRPPQVGKGIFNVVSEFGVDPTGANYTQPAIQEAINDKRDRQSFWLV